MISNSRIRSGALYALLWLFLAISFASKAYLEYAFRGNRAAWNPVFIWELTGWGIWGAMGPFLYRFTRKFPMNKKSWLRYLPLYIVCAVVVPFLHLLLHIALDRYLMSLIAAPYGSFIEDFTANFISRITWRLLVYAVLIIICHGWEAQRKLRNEQKRAAELQTQLAQAQLEALKMQMHPHFLFNTLHSLTELIHRDVRAAEEGLIKLSDFLRMTLRSPGGQEVPLRKELEFLQCYLEIEKIRLQERLQVLVNVDAELLNIPVPNLILQPLVENAVRHAIAPKSAMGKIEIHATRNDSVLRIEIKDNGPGLPPASNVEDYFEKGLGLSNTRARLQKLYGSKQRMSLENSAEGGLTVALEIPVHQEMSL